MVSHKRVKGGGEQKHDMVNYFYLAQADTLSKKIVIGFMIPVNI